MNPITATDWRVRKTLEERLKAQIATKEIFTGTIDDLKRKLKNRMSTVARQFGKNMVPRDIICNALEDMIYEIEQMRVKRQ